LNLESLDLGELVLARRDNLSTLAAQRRVRINVEVRVQAKVRGDADRLIQILDNLLDNAIRHAPAESAVTVIVQQVGREVQCAVSDQGPGIPAQHLPFIFERFYRVDTSRNRHTGGSGLGLAIVRSLVLAQGGRVTAENLENRGTTITFWLPADEN
jgi:signal transduction histidine kinase